MDRFKGPGGSNDLNAFRYTSHRSDRDR